ncbi:MAG: NUDIX domain-containing protein [Candidatus Dormibacter sp.]
MERRAVRALVIDASKRLLLLRGELPDREPWWFAPGGAVDPGETDEAALIRELSEEIGLTVDLSTLLPAVWTRDYLFTWKGAVERHLERFFLIETGGHDVDPDSEAGAARNYRWWSLEEVQSSHDLFAPRTLAEHLAPLLHGRFPPEPVEVGE